MIIPWKRRRRKGGGGIYQTRRTAHHSQSDERKKDYCFRTERYRYMSCAPCPAKPLRERIVCLHWKRTTVHLSFSFLVYWGEKAGLSRLPLGRATHGRQGRLRVPLPSVKKKKEGKGTAQRKSSENMPQRDLLRWIERIEVKTIRPAASESGATFLFIHLPGTALLSPTSTPTRSHEKKSTKGQQEIALLELPRSQCSYRGRWKTPNEGFQRLPLKKKNLSIFLPTKQKNISFNTGLTIRDPSVPLY